MTRSSALVLAAALAIGLLGHGEARAHATPSRPLAKKPAKRWPAVEMQHLTTHEKFTIRPNPAGHLGAKQLRGLRRFLRCHHTGRQHPMADRLPLLLYTAATHFKAKVLYIVAGYRAPKIAKEKGNPRSPHKLGRACDFKIEGVATTELRDYLRTFDRVGVGYYPNSGFVHLDVGRKARAFWIDYSAPGESARYSPDAESDLRSGRADGGADPQGSPPPDPDDEAGEPVPAPKPAAPAPPAP